MVVCGVGTVVDTEHDIIVNDVPIITPNGDVIVSSLTFKVRVQCTFKLKKDNIVTACIFVTSETLGMARVVKGSHSLTCHPQFTVHTFSREQTVPY